MRIRGSSRPKDDRITHLPEPIRTKIISLLPMEDAIRTSILSREWRHVTTCLPNLDFDQEAFDKRKSENDHFRNFVDRLLINRDRVDVERFSLSTNSDEVTLLHINAWILFALRNNVREFHLSHHTGPQVTLPSRFFQCSTIIELSLAGFQIKVPPNVCYPSLKRFKLSDVRFMDGGLHESFFSNFPVIEELRLINCEIWSRSGLTISSLTLKILTLSFYSTLSIYSFAYSEIKIHARNLQQLEYRYSQVPTISSETLCSLSRAAFEVWVSSGNRACRENSILIGLSNVVRLCLGDLYIQEISKYPDSLELLPFSNSCSILKHLDIDIGARQLDVDVVLSLLKIYTNLVTLCVSFGITILGFGDFNLDMGSQKFISKHLTAIEVKKLTGSKDEVDIIRYLLENASGLETMKITYRFPPMKKKHVTARTKVRKELLKVRKASARATIVFN